MNTTITRRDGPAGRFYEIDGVLYPSVTHILSAAPKPALIHWAANEERKLVSEAAADLYADIGRAGVPQLPRAAYLATLHARLGPTKAHLKARDHAADIGSGAHRLIEWAMRTAIGADAGPKPIVSNASLWAFMAFEDWAKSVCLKPVLIERTVYSTMHGFAGTLDVLARVNGVLTHIDFKTGKAVYAEAHLQSAAYQTALIEMGYLPPAGGGLIVRLPKVESDPAFEVVAVPEAATLLPVFLAMKAVWAWMYQQDEAYRQRRARKAS